MQIGSPAVLHLFSVRSSSAHFQSTPPPPHKPPPNDQPHRLKASASVSQPPTPES